MVGVGIGGGGGIVWSELVSEPLAIDGWTNE